MIFFQLLEIFKWIELLQLMSYSIEWYELYKILSKDLIIRIKCNHQFNYSIWTIHGNPVSNPFQTYYYYCEYTRFVAPSSISLILTYFLLFLFHFFFFFSWYLSVNVFMQTWYCPLFPFQQKLDPKIWPHPDSMMIKK